LPKYAGVPFSQTNLGSVQVPQGCPTTTFEREGVDRVRCKRADAKSQASGPLQRSVTAAEISTHVLDLASVIGKRDVLMVLLRKSDKGRWDETRLSRTDENGRSRSFGGPSRFAPGTYKLRFEMSGYPDAKAAPFS
jgi:hypothetical protein